MNNDNAGRLCFIKHRSAAVVVAIAQKGKKMKHIHISRMTAVYGRAVSIILFLLFLLTNSVANALAETAVASPAVMRIVLPDKWKGKAYMLGAACRVEDGTCWFIGGSSSTENWILQTDTDGNILQERSITGVPGKYPVIECLSQVEDTIMLCFIDGDTMIGTLGIMENPADDIKYQNLGKLKIFNTQATPKGILVSGILYNNAANTYHLQINLFGPQGEILFQYNGVAYNIDTRTSGMTSSLCVAADDCFYVQECWDQQQSFYNNRALVCVDPEGNEVWRILLEDRIRAYGIAATEGGVYLVGSTYDLDAEGTAENKRAFVRYYTNAGILQWTHAFDEIERLMRVTANSDAVVVWSRNGVLWYFNAVNTDGTLRDVLQINSKHITSVVSNMYALENGSILALGHDYYDLLMFEIPLE